MEKTEKKGKSEGTHTARWKMPRELIAKVRLNGFVIQSKFWKNVSMMIGRNHLEMQSFSLLYSEELNYS